MHRKKTIDTEMGHRLQAGDEAAFAQFFNDWRVYVYSTALRYLKSPCDAEDAVQEVFLLLWKNVSKWDASKGPLGGWFQRLAKHRIIDIYRGQHRKKHETLASLDFELDSQDSAGSETPLSLIVDPSSPDPIHLLIAEETENAILKALLSIPRSEHRLAWRLKHVDGYSDRDISEILGCTVGCAKIWMYRAMQLMRKRLESIK